MLQQAEVFFPAIFQILTAQAWSFDSSTDAGWQLLPVGDLLLGGVLLCLQWQLVILWINDQNWFQTTSWGLNSFLNFQKNIHIYKQTKTFFMYIFPIHVYSPPFSFSNSDKMCILSIIHIDNFIESLCNLY